MKNNIHLKKLLNLLINLFWINYIFIFKKNLFLKKLSYNRNNQQLNIYI